MAWKIVASSEFAGWFRAQEPDLRDDITAAVNRLAAHGPTLGRPLVDHIEGSKIHNLKELRIGTVRILFAFGPNREAVLLVAGDKERLWNKWYRRNIPLAEGVFNEYLEQGTST